MAKLPDDQNPLKRTSLYDFVDVDPFTRSGEINARLEALDQSKLPGSSETEKSALFQQLAKGLKSKTARVLMNALILDRVESHDMASWLDGVAKLDAAEFKLPEPGLSQVLIEGESLDTSEADCRDISPDESLLLNPDDIRDELLGRGHERHIHFDS